MPSGKIVQWLKAEGDKVEESDVVMIVESDKADMDVESYSSGEHDGFFLPIINRNEWLGGLATRILINQLILI